MAQLPPEVVEAWITLCEETFFNIMTAMVKAESVEEDFAKLRAEVRNKTTEQQHLLARYAGEYYVQHANPGLSNMSKAEVPRLKRKAIECALKKLSDEATK